MHEPIIARATMQDRGAEAFLSGKSRDDHNMNWHAPALVEWLAGYDAEAQAHSAIQAAMRVDVAQGVA